MVRLLIRRFWVQVPGGVPSQKSRSEAILARIWNFVVSADPTSIQRFARNRVVAWAHTGSYEGEEAWNLGADRGYRPRSSHKSPSPTYPNASPPRLRSGEIEPPSIAEIREILAAADAYDSSFGVLIRLWQHVATTTC
jgi:hypothetical protein